MHLDRKAFLNILAGNTEKKEEKGCAPGHGSRVEMPAVRGYSTSRI